MLLGFLRNTIEILLNLSNLQYYFTELSPLFFCADERHCAVAKLK